jgi:hypothetical protein
MVLAYQLPPGRDAVQLVDEHDTGCELPRPREDAPQALLALTYPAGQDLRTTDDLEVGVTFGGHSFGQERLAIARGAVQDNTALRLNAQRLEVGRVTQGELNHILDSLQRRLQAGNVRIARVRDVAHPGRLRFATRPVRPQPRCPATGSQGWLGLNSQGLRRVVNREADLELAVPTQGDDLGRSLTSARTRSQRKAGTGHRPRPASFAPGP